MTRYIDILRRAGFVDRPDVVTIFAQDIYEMLHGQEVQYGDMLNLHSVVPPFNETFVEFFMRTPDRKQGMNVGVLLHRDDDSPERKTILDLFENESGQEARWVIAGWIYSDMFRDNKIPLWELGYMINPEGQLIQDNQSGEICLTQPFISLPETRELFNHPDMITLSRSILGVVWNTFAFCATKNIELVEQIPPPKLSKKHKKKHGVPLEPYHVLKIRGTRRVYDPSGRGRGSPSRSHIVSGHWKTYTDDNPLYGKHTGTYWWNNHVRGSGERIQKDYEIQVD